MANETWLVAHDLSPFGQMAAEHAAETLAKCGGELILLYAHADLHVRPEHSTGEETFKFEQEIRGQLEKVQEGLQSKFGGVKVRVETVIGKPAAMICDEAERFGCRQIIVGTHGRTGLSRAVLGSVAEAVLKNSTVPVLIVKDKSAK